MNIELILGLSSPRFYVGSTKWLRRLGDRSVIPMSGRGERQRKRNKRRKEADHLTVVSDAMDLSLSDVDIPDEITELDLNQLHELSQGLLAEAEGKKVSRSSNASCFLFPPCCFFFLAFFSFLTLMWPFAETDYMIKVDHRGLRG